MINAWRRLTRGSRTQQISRSSQKYQPHITPKAQNLKKQQTGQSALKRTLVMYTPCKSISKGFFPLILTRDTTKALQVSNIMGGETYYIDIVMYFPLTIIEVGCLFIRKINIFIYFTEKFNFMCFKHFYLVTSIFFLLIERQFKYILYMWCLLPQHSSKPITVHTFNKKFVKELVFTDHPPLNTPDMRLPGIALHQEICIDLFALKLWTR